MREIREIEREGLRTDHPQFRSGDTVRVHVRITEGDKERVQVFEGVVIQRHRGGMHETFTVRKVSYGVGVERIFPLHSPFVKKVVVKRSGKTRRARLYYLRDRSGKATRLREIITRRVGAKKPAAKPALAPKAAPPPEPEPIRATEAAED